MSGLFGTLGGLGLFLLGMRVLTGGLHELSRGATSVRLGRIAGGPWRAAATGAGLTAVVQSSSATTLTAIGFVGAGLLTFPQALGVVLGANVGTTVTGWLVTLFGFKVPLGQLAAPLCFLGMALRLSDARGRRGAIGEALAGFGLVFVGIGAMQVGLAGLESHFGPEDLPTGAGLGGRLGLVAFGAALTAVTQSSSAGVATALAALHLGRITYPQAAAMVIGMDVGTTVTAVLAALGGTAQVRRTSAAHVTFNLLTMAGALALLDPWQRGLEALEPGWIAAQPELALVAFHTGFNLLGAIAVLPFARPFARAIERLVPEHASPLVRAIESTPPTDAALALTAVRASLESTAASAFADLAARLSGEPPQDPAEVDAAIAAIARYLAGITTADAAPELQVRHGELLHVYDHLERLATRAGRERGAATVRDEPLLVGQGRQLVEALTSGVGPSGGLALDVLAARLDALHGDLEGRDEATRGEFIGRASRGVHTPAEALGRLDAERWLRRVTAHAARIVAHLARADAVV